MTVSNKLAAFTHSFDYDSIPDEVISQAKLHFMDSLGVILAAATFKSGKNILRAGFELGAGDESLAIGEKRRIPAHLAALVSGTMLHSLEYDDTHTDSIIHASSVVVPTALAVGEWVKASGKQVLAAMVLGWETIIRFGLAAPNQFQSRGFHTTAVCGPFSSAIITGFLKQAEESVIAAALGIAGSQSSGIFEYLADGATVKQSHPGWAAHNGIVALRMAEHEIRGPMTVFEGRFGFYNTFAGQGNFNIDTVLDSLGEKWFTSELSYKPYPCCHFNHAFVDCVRDLLKDGLEISDIDKVICRVAPEIVQVVCEPWENKIHPKTGYEARFSLPFAVASALFDRDVTLDSYNDQSIERQELANLMGKITYELDGNSNYPKSFPGWVEVITVNQKTLQKKLKFNRGGPKNPLSQERVEEKFINNASRYLESDKVEKLKESVLHIENLADINELMNLLR